MQCVEFALRTRFGEVSERSSQQFSYRGTGLQEHAKPTGARPRDATLVAHGPTKMPFNMPLKKSITKPRGKREARSAIKGEVPKTGRVKGNALLTKVVSQVKKSKSSAMEVSALATDPSFKLCLKSLDDGEEKVEMHATAEDAAAAAWRWGSKKGLCLVSSDWDVVHPDYGWQDAYNVMITREDFMGDDNELRGFFTNFFIKCMNSASCKFEAKGEGTSRAYNGIACYQNHRIQPFWPR